MHLLFLCCLLGRNWRKKLKEDGAKLEFRLVGNCCGIRPGLKTAVPYDYLDTSPGSRWDQFLSYADEELRQHATSSELGESNTKNLPGMLCFHMGVRVLQPMEMKSSTHGWLNYPERKSRMMSITMRDRSKNRKQLQKGRNLSIEAIQTIQALKRAANHSEALLGQVYDNKFRRLLKFDMIAVLRDLLRQNQCALALKVFEDVRKEEWYRPKLFLYSEMVSVLGSNGLLEKVELLIMELKSESAIIDPTDLEGFNVLLESLMNLNLTRLAMECYSLMKSLPCDPDRLSYKILMNGLESNGEMNRLDVIQQEAKKEYGDFLNIIDDEETCMR